MLFIVAGRAKLPDWVIIRIKECGTILWEITIEALKKGNRKRVCDVNRKIERVRKRRQKIRGELETTE